ncbi:anthranilate synthase component I family protein [Bermanella sp. R86510]|uniref:anthranilate synthase component I family protein n=1 Tax=unclassified Bermanella TaxID=2627862 RepID=UPI0037CC36F3
MPLNVCEVPYLSSTEQLLSNLKHLPYLVALESGGATHENGRWSIISANPSETWSMTSYEQKDQLKTQLKRLSNIIPHNHSELPFSGGVIGLLNYDLGELAIKQNTPWSSQGPLAFIGVYAWSYLFDHEARKGYCIHWPEYSLESFETIKALHPELNPEITRKYKPVEFKITQEIKADWSLTEYAQRFDRVKRYINEGDCYQINLTQRFRGKYTGHALAAYHRLKQCGQAPFSTYFDLGDTQLASASPELFIAYENGIATTKPIKGTRPISQNSEQDALNKQELANSEKDKAENVMIVDLLRNDLSKHATHVRVEKLFNIETFKTVHHMVSTIRADVETNKVADLLLDAFPGGSITGAPKTRAMEIIKELEDRPRSYYCGTCFYMSSNEKMNSNILIRSFVFNKGEVACWAGGGIVADSTMEAEHQESLDKISRLISSLSL